MNLIIRLAVSFAIVFLFAGALAAQPTVPQIPDGPPMVPQAPPAKQTDAPRPIVVFSHMPERYIPGCDTYRDDAWHPVPAIHVYANGVNGGGTRYRANVDDATIRRVAGLEAGQRAVFFPQEVAADDKKPDARVALLVPKGVRFYSLRPLYQKMYTMNNGRSRFADPTPIEDEESHPFLVSGGMAGLRGWRSDKGLLLPKDAKITVWKEDTDVRAFSLVPRWRWRFPVGAVAYDVLSTDKGVFEVRTQTRSDDGWETKVTFKDEKARPEGYEGLQQSCASCHSHTGTIVSVPGRVYLRERWGSDGRFSWRPYDESGGLDTSWPIEVK